MDGVWKSFYEHLVMLCYTLNFCIRFEVNVFFCEILYLKDGYGYPGVPWDISLDS